MAPGGKRPALFCPGGPGVIVCEKRGGESGCVILLGDKKKFPIWPGTKIVPGHFSRGETLIHKISPALCSGSPPYFFRSGGNPPIREKKKNLLWARRGGPNFLRGLCQIFGNKKKLQRAPRSNCNAFPGDGGGDKQGKFWGPAQLRSTGGMLGDGFARRGTIIFPGREGPRGETGNPFGASEQGNSPLCNPLLLTLKTYVFGALSLYRGQLEQYFPVPTPERRWVSFFHTTFPFSFLSRH